MFYYLLFSFNFTSFNMHAYFPLYIFSISTVQASTTMYHINKSW